MTIFSKFHFTSLLFFIAYFFSTQSQAQSLNLISAEELMKTDRFLAGKELAGRLPGSDGFLKAANYMAAQLSKCGLDPINGKSYFQNFVVEYNEILPGEHFAIIKNNNRTEYVLGKDYIYRGFTGSGNFTAPVAFCGYGLSQPDLGYDDYAGIDVKGRVVMVYKYNPSWKLNEKTFTNGNPREKAIVAAKHGAIGILFISFPNDKDPQRPIGSVIHGDGEQMLNFPEIHIDLPLAAELYDGCGYTLQYIQAKIDSLKIPYSFNLNNRVDIDVKTNYTKEKEVSNVCGILQGSDPKLRDEFIIIGAHLDHVGSQAGKVYFPGANDNGSGSSALLQIVRAITSLKPNPKRSICFIFFACEEQGMNGSIYFANNLPFPKEKASTMINMDCVGYGDSIQVNGGDNFKDMWEKVKTIDRNNSRLLVSRSGGGGGADAQPFFDKGIKTLYFVTTNSYAHLHQLSDLPETLNQHLFESTTRLAFLTLLEFANE